MTTKRFSATLKSVGEDGHGSWTAVASTPSIDRDNEIVDSRAFEPLPARVPVHAEHFGEIIGSGRPYYEGNTLYIDGQFASTPKAQVVRRLVREGHLQTMSVAFLPRQHSKGGSPRHIVKGELLAVDWASIPSNRDALVLAAKALKANVDIPAAVGPDDQPRTLAQAVDAVLDELVDAFSTNDLGSAAALVTAAQATVDSLLVALGATDADDDSMTDAPAPKGFNPMSHSHDDDDAEFALRAKAVQLRARALVAITEAENVSAVAEKAASRQLLERQIGWAREQVKAKADFQRQLAEKGNTSKATLSPYDGVVPCSMDPEVDPDAPEPVSSTAPVHSYDREPEIEPAYGGLPAGTVVSFTERGQDEAR